MTDLTRRQCRLLCDIATKGAIDALLFSEFRSEGPGLRELELIVGIGDSTCISDEAHALLAERAKGGQS